MFNAKLYHQCNAVPKRDSQECLERYANKIKWRADDSVIDLGCGDGSVTTNILKKCMPLNFKKLVGIDISETMIQFAKEHHGNERTVFSVLDVGGDLPAELSNSFDHAFSFFSIHWIRNQDRVFANINSLLKEEGNCLLAFLGYTPIYEIWRTLSRHAKWQPWLGNVESYVSPYHDVQVPEKQVKHIMLEKGFRNIDVNCLNKEFMYDNVELFENTMEAVSPFKIPSDLRDNFMEDFMHVVRDIGMIEKINNVDEPVVKVKYDLIVAFGCKQGRI